MTHPTTTRPARLRALLLALFLSVPGALAAQAPRIEKVEPANWWVGMRWDTVQLMVYGADLDGVSARFVERDGNAGAGAGVGAGAAARATDPPAAAPTVVEVVPAATPAHAFVYVHVPAGLAPGTYTLELSRDGEGETATVDYPLLERAPAEGRYQGFGPQDVVYLLMPDRFANAVPANDVVEGLPDEHDRSEAGARHGGDLEGIIQRLDYLADLGVTALWLNPVLENSAVGSYHGYAATDLYRIDPRFGSNEDYRRLVEEAHARGLKVIFDHISNHIGVEHPWLDALPTETWLHGSVEDHLLEKHYMMSIADPYAPQHAEEMLEEFWFVSGMPDLNQRDPLLADYLIQNTIWWIEYSGLDGIREDTYPYPDQQFLADWAAAIFDEYPDFNIVGEIWSGEPAFTALFQEGSPLPRDFETNLPTVMDFALSDAWRAYIGGYGTLEGVYQVLAQDFLYGDPLHVVTFLDNHDMPRAMLVAEGAGERAAAEAAVARVKQGLAMLLTTRRIPQILYGTEIGMVGGESHIELRADMPGGWPEDERSVFTAEGRTADEAEIFDYLRRLLHVRQAHPALQTGDLTHIQPSWNHNVYRYLRTTADETVLVVVNGYGEDRTIGLAELAPLLPAWASFIDLMTGERTTITVDSGVPVDAWGTRILEVDGER